MKYGLPCSSFVATLLPVKKAKKATKDETLRMRVSASDKTALLEAARRDGLEFSQWARRTLLRAAGVLPQPK
jgi:uncharacterized protein (DUF1778 family)